MKTSIEITNQSEIHLSLFPDHTNNDKNDMVLKSERKKSQNIIKNNSDIIPKKNFLQIYSLKNVHTLRHTSLNPNNIFSTITMNDELKGEEQFKKLVKFVILKIMLPLFSFTGVCFGLIYLQVFVNDYCFSPEICACDNILIFLYVLIKEALHTYLPVLIGLYYAASFVTDSFYKRIYIKIIYIVLVLILLTLYSWSSYKNRKKPILSLLAMMNGLLLFLGNFFFIIILGLLFKKFSKQFLKRLIVSSLLQLYLFFHRYYFRSFANLYILKPLQNHFEVNLSINMFKTFLMIYYFLFYENLSKYFLFSFFKDISSENLVSFNIIIFYLKLVSIDVLSSKALNVLTIPLDDLLSWICLIFYFYSIFSVYTRTNILISVFLNLFRKIFKLPPSKPSEESKSQRFKDLRSGCIFETNLIVFLRIICFKISNHFFLFTDYPNLYEDCSLKEKMNSFELFDINTILLMITHTSVLVILGILIYGYKKSNLLFNYHIEEINIFGRLLLFIVCFSYADYTLQMYKVFGQQQ